MDHSQSLLVLVDILASMAGETLWRNVASFTQFLPTFSANNIQMWLVQNNIFCFETIFLFMLKNISGPTWSFEPQPPKQLSGSRGWTKWKFIFVLFRETNGIQYICVIWEYANDGWPKRRLQGKRSLSFRSPPPPAQKNHTKKQRFLYGRINTMKRSTMKRTQKGCTVYLSKC